jgi:hypothetical protein
MLTPRNGSAQTRATAIPDMVKKRHGGKFWLAGTGSKMLSDAVVHP